jgi:transcriptional regulator NrdR family protein
MICPYCGSYQVRTVDSRPYDIEVRRTKECRACSKKFKTIEIPLDGYKAIKDKAALFTALTAE